ncbi:MAG: MotA/TolQ/ExbB proton channel family protein [Erythrobacter sp.]
MGGAGFSLINPEAAVIVLGGTCVASGLACGWNNLHRAVAQAFGLLGAPFDEAANRSALARLIYVIDRKGRFAAHAPLPPDPALAEIVTAYLRRGEIACLREAHRAHLAAARKHRSAAAATWQQAGELAPVAGLAGTLYGIAQLAPVGTGMVGGALALSTASAIATAVVSTFYGLLLAHLVCLPLAGAIARRGQAEQAQRIRLVGWFESQLPTLPRPARPLEPPAVLAEVA